MSNPLFRNKLTKTQKIIFFIVLTLLYLALLYFVKYKKGNEVALFYKINDIVVWPAIFYIWIFCSRNNNSSIYFKKENYDNIVADLKISGFDKYKETSSKIKFKDNNKWYKQNRIFIYKHKNGIWELDAENKFIKNFEKYIVKYVKI